MTNGIFPSHGRPALLCSGRWLMRLKLSPSLTPHTKETERTLKERAAAVPRCATRGRPIPAFREPVERRVTPVSPVFLKDVFK
ncbi:hypothetical protein EYF80_052944 [Liparis tanakae]|uniref:Uncharacterized protein n=1 Tax=Liparis tanakae TaxID=230148 RepID=A0A4Z2F7V8_9TELE|nr:hypothetical protein EYF80_052944 [Liparis tanakae]